MKPIRVLIADDQTLFAGSLKVVLGSHGRGALTVVGVAQNGQEAIEMVAEYHPDVVLMDVRMPVMDGVAATREISRKHPDVKIMILTTFDDDDYALEALNSGATGYVLKDIQPNDLVTAVQAIYSGSVLLSSTVGVRLMRHAKGELSTDELVAHDELRALMSEFPQLTRREVEVLRLAAQNLDNHEISETLFIAEQTVKNHISRLFGKLGVSDRLHLIQLARRKMERRSQ
jgi:DNA-binding NarL/FixJ family response regulator